MDHLTYKPNSYEGKDPYICISCHPADKQRLEGVLQKLELRGFRFWLEDGIEPGADTDEIIAEHIEGCAFFVAFLSKAYLACLDTLDELNYSRDTNKDYLLVYLEDTALPYGLDMRFGRARSVKAFELSDEDVYNAMLSIPGAQRFYGIADESLRARAEQVFAQLEALYPEHKVFALDAVDKQLARNIAKLYVEAGYPGVDRLLQDYGFVHISTEAARALRGSVLYQPGFEPPLMREKIERIMEFLTAEYPDKYISTPLSKTYPSIYKALMGISVWMGYDSAADMMAAYGFSGVTGEAGRSAVDHEEILRRLEKRYEGRNKPATLMQLLAENADMSANLKTLTNRAHELFGMSLLRYLRSVGLIVRGEKEETSSATAKNRARMVEDIRALYRSEPIDYGTLEEADGALNQLVLRRYGKGPISVADCSSCGETMKIPYGIEYIAREAFSGQTDLVTLILPPTLKEIKAGAFSDCTSLTAVVLPEGLTRIDNNAFANCTALTRILLPESLKSVGNQAFAGCQALSEVIFGNLRTNVQEDAFDDCPYELESLQDADATPADQFELKVDKKNCAKIIAYTGDDAVVVIPGIIGGHPIVSIEKGAFKGNSTLREVYISDHIAAVNGDVFRDCPNLEKVHLSDAVTKLTGSAFAGCGRLAEINIPDAMTEVPRGLFKDAPLTTLYIGKGVKSISPDAFYKGVPDLATGAYLKQRVLQELIVDTGNETFSAVGTTLLSRDGTVLFAELGDPVRAVIPDGVEEICAQAYEKLGSLTEVRFPHSLKKIGEKAFAGTGLRQLDLPVGLAEIGAQAFSFCRSLSDVNLYDGLRVIGEQAFEGCPIRDVYIPASVEILGGNSFLAISTYQGEVAQRFRVDTANRHIIADGIALYQRAGQDLILLKAYAPELQSKPDVEAVAPVDYEVLAGTVAIEPRAFARCNNLNAVALPEGLRSIGDLAFWDCSGLSEVHIPQSCTELSPKAFFGITVTLI